MTKLSKMRSLDISYYASNPRRQRPRTSRRGSVHKGLFQLALAAGIFGTFGFTLVLAFLLLGG